MCEKYLTLSNNAKAAVEYVKDHARDLALDVAYLGGVISLAAGAVATEQRAYADPSWNITTTRAVGNYDADVLHIGDEQLFQYFVTNTSEPDLIYDLDSFAVPFGSDQGVYDVTGPDGWTPIINQESTIWDLGSGSYIHSNGGQGLFEIYSTNLGTSAGQATGFTILNEPFPDVEINGPNVVPVPGAVFLATIGLGAAGLKLRNQRNKEE